MTAKFMRTIVPTRNHSVAMTTPPVGTCADNVIPYAWVQTHTFFATCTEVLESDSLIIMDERAQHASSQCLVDLGYELYVG